MLNLLEIIVLGALILLVLSGLTKGFVMKLASMISLVLSVVLVSFLLPYMTEFLKERTPVYEYIVEQCQSVISDQVNESLTGGVKVNTEAGAQQVSVPDTLNLSESEQSEVIESLPLPESLKEQIQKYNNKDGYRSLKASTFQDYVINYVASAILNLLSFLLALVLVQVFLWFLIRALNLLAHFPILSLVNRLAGGALGGLQWLFFLWLFFLVLSMCQSTGAGQYLLQMVWDSDFLNVLYDSNFFMQIVLQTAAIFA